MLLAGKHASLRETCMLIVDTSVFLFFALSYFREIDPEFPQPMQHLCCLFGPHSLSFFFFLFLTIYIKKNPEKNTIV